MVKQHEYGSASSVTRREIDTFWRNRRFKEEEHFLAALKAAARIRASRLTEHDYLVFLQEEIAAMGDDQEEIRGSVGIKDWWTKSKYAYLNEPALGLERGNRKWNYTPNKIWL